MDLLWKVLCSVKHPASRDGEAYCKVHGNDRSKRKFIGHYNINKCKEHLFPHINLLLVLWSCCHTWSLRGDYYSQCSEFLSHWLLNLISNLVRREDRVGGKDLSICPTCLSLDQNFISAKYLTLFVKISGCLWSEVKIMRETLSSQYLNSSNTIVLEEIAKWCQKSQLRVQSMNSPKQMRVWCPHGPSHRCASLHVHSTNGWQSWFDAGPIPGTHESCSFTLPCHRWAEEKKIQKVHELR